MENNVRNENDALYKTVVDRLCKSSSFSLNHGCRRVSNDINPAINHNFMQDSPETDMFHSNARHGVTISVYSDYEVKRIKGRLLSQFSQ